jgi:hypothetical protein
MSRLAEILQQEYKTKGIIGGATSTLGKRALEKLDVRNALFGGSGIGSIVGTKIFGKGYSATRGSGSDKTTSPVNETLSSGSSPLLQEININSKITAKNSMALPSMAKQMNIMQKNTAKLVKIWGGTPTTKADSFFSNSKFKENQYESQFNSSKKPTKVETKEKSTGGILGMLGSLAGGIMSIIAGAATSIASVVKGLEAIPSVLAGLGAAAVGLGAALTRILGFLVRSPIGRLLGLVGIGVGAAAISKIFGSETDNSVGANGGEYSTAEKVGYTAAGTAGAVMGANSIKKKLTPPAKTPGALTDFGEVGAKRAAAQTKWGRFLIFLEKKAPRLFARIGVKLAAMSGLAAVPIAGWVGALITAGFIIWDIVFLFDMWTEFSNEETNSKTPTPKPLDISSNTYDAMGNVTGTTSSPSKIPSSETQTSGTTTPTGQSSTRDRQQIEAYLGKAISDKEYDALLRTVGAEAGKDPMERAAVASVILNRAKKIGGDIIATLNSPGQFQAITGPDGKSGNVDNPWSANAKKIIPGIEKDISSNIASVPKGLDSFTSAIASAYGAVGGQRKFEQKMAEMSSLGGTKIGQSVFASAGVSATQIAGSPKINGSTVASASQSINSSGTGQNMFTPEDLASLANIMGSQTMINGGGGLNEVVSSSKSTPYQREFYSNMVNNIAL